MARSDGQVVSSFYQATHWTTRAGHTMRLEEMPPGHRANLLKYIWKNFSIIRAKLGWWWAMQVSTHDGGDMAHDRLQAEADAFDEMSDHDLYHSLPLVKRLRWLNRPTAEITLVSREGQVNTSRTLLAYRTLTAEEKPLFRQELIDLARAVEAGTLDERHQLLISLRELEHARKVFARLNYLAEEANRDDDDTDCPFEF